MSKFTAIHRSHVLSCLVSLGVLMGPVACKSATPNTASPPASPTSPPTWSSDPPAIEVRESPQDASQDAALVVPTPPALSAAAVALGGSLSGPGLVIYRTQSAPAGTNIVLSPSDIGMALAQVMAGAQGSTAAELARALGVQSFSALTAPLQSVRAHWAYDAARGGHELALGARVWPSRTITILPDFSQSIRDVFGSSTEALDYANAPDAACARINDWISTQTHGLIRDALNRGVCARPPKVLLTTSTYFAGKWDEPFVPAFTQSHWFMVSATHGKRVPTMSATRTLPYLENSAARMIELPYAGGELVMDLAIPRAANGLTALRATMTAERWAAWSQSAQAHRVSVELALPRFSVRQQTELDPLLIRQGIRSLFTSSSNLSGMTADGPVAIEGVRHIALVRVDEEGTVAAAVTIMGGIGAGTPASVPFRVNQPFLFAIRHVRTHAVLFAGAVVDVDTSIPSVPHTLAAEATRESASEGFHSTPAMHPLVNSGVPTTEGTLSGEVVRRVMRQRLGRIGFCYERVLAQDPLLEGGVMATFTIDAEGRAREVSVTMQRPASPLVSQLTQCIADVIIRMGFPTSPERPTQVRYPFLLSSPDVL
ncbi:MAG: serpin family protein [Deltaproteobacteria bacterium]|nr:serpin family protein [Deltaproteobacteria bacterium]